MAYGVNTMTTFRNEEENQSQVVARSNLHYLLQRLAGLAEDSDRKPDSLWRTGEDVAREHRRAESQS